MATHEEIAKNELRLFKNAQNKRIMQRPSDLPELPALKEQVVATVTNPITRVVMASFPIVIGAAIICAAAGIIPIKGHAPTLLLFCVGATFSLGGICAILQEVKTAAAQVLANILGLGVFCFMATIFYWFFFVSPAANNPVLGLFKWILIGFTGLMILLTLIAKVWPGGPITVTTIKRGEPPPPNLEITDTRRKRK